MANQELKTKRQWLSSLANEDVEWEIKEFGDLDKAYLAYVALDKAYFAYVKDKEK